MSIQKVPDQSRLHSETLSQETSFIPKLELNKMSKFKKDFFFVDKKGDDPKESKRF